MDATPAVNDMQNVTCPNCGASLAYKPGTTSLVCEHCNSSFEIKTENASLADAQKENDLSAALTGSWQASQPQVQAYVVKCPACGAETALEKNIFSSACAFCGTPLSVQPDQRSVAHPQAVLPFKFERESAVSDFNKWLRKLWFAPNDLKKTATSERFNGIYLPFWTFDAETATDYRGERGIHYYETVRNSKGETTRVMRTRWSAVSGMVSRAFNDILVTASRALPEKYLARLEPWDLDNLLPYDNRYLAGFKAEVSQVNIQDGFQEAKGIMEVTIRQDVHRDIGGDEQRIGDMQTRYSATTYKYILLPVWLSVYRYGNKVYRFVVNARTGEVHGERPYSAIKIILAVVLVLAVIAAIVYFTGQH